MGRYVLIFFDKKNTVEYSRASGNPSLQQEAARSRDLDALCEVTKLEVTFNSNGKGATKQFTV